MTQTLTYRIHDVVPYINWIYFFHAWGFPPRFAAVSRLHGCESCRSAWLSEFPEAERERASEALRLFQDARSMLAQLDEKFYTHVRFGLYPANADGDDLRLTDPDVPGRKLRLPLLRQQHTVKPGEPYLCLSDFVRPLEQGRPDTVGVFAATVDPEMEHLYEKGEEADDFKHLLGQTLSDRLAEASTEKMHQEVRKTYWGYASNEQLSISDLLIEKFTGIRPAVGYPSLPDQSVNFILSEWLGFPEIGIHLTENGAMVPHASVSGLILAHPSARYFAVGKIGEDQLRSYAQRRGLSSEEVRKILAANLTT
ncbi:MAG: 5-methyltetrahydrofolate--homocysteine methyltransferase [Paraprevotella sp.]|nr:5-methyltetrahydrofolate--homocysteine methyltransferase [Paraprevotella sp.]